MKFLQARMKGSQSKCFAKKTVRPLTVIVQYFPTSSLHLDNWEPEQYEADTNGPLTHWTHQSTGMFSIEEKLY